jgi:hypothetical protein
MWVPNAGRGKCNGLRDWLEFLKAYVSSLTVKI